MSFKSQPSGVVPEETACVARAVFPLGYPYLRLRDALGALYEDLPFVPLFLGRGQYHRLRPAAQSFGLRARFLPKARCSDPDVF